MGIIGTRTVVSCFMTPRAARQYEHGSTQLRSISTTLVNAATVLLKLWEPQFSPMDDDAIENTTSICVI